MGAKNRIESNFGKTKKFLKKFSGKFRRRTFAMHLFLNIDFIKLIV